MTKKTRPVDASLAAAIKKAALTHYSLGQMAGVAPAQIDRFISGERGLSLATASKLCVALGLELRPAA